LLVHAKPRRVFPVTSPAKAGTHESTDHNLLSGFRLSPEDENPSRLRVFAWNLSDLAELIDRLDQRRAKLSLAISIANSYQ
jgi:hypothetical protein